MGEASGRRTEELGGLWEFAFLGAADAGRVDARTIKYDDVMLVPMCFDATPRYAGKRGLAAYRRRVRLEGGARYRLTLDGVHHWGRVLLLPRKQEVAVLRDHVGGFARFHADFEAGEAGEYDLVILVDNRLDYQRCPLHLDYFDWYNFGGISRGVWVTRLPEVAVDRAWITTTNYPSRRVNVRVEWSGVGKGTLPLSLSVDGRPVLAEKVAGGSGSLEREIELAGASLWSPGSPALHELTVRVGEDEVRETFGLRQVSVEGEKILINGEPVRLWGFNRHESHPQFGHAVPAGVMASDLQQIRDMGGNFVRGSHYPQDGRFLEMCDRAGVCVWSESIGWQHTAAHLTDPKFIEAQLTNIEEMIAAAYNHPSVILWGLLNESESHVAAARPGYERLIKRIRELDGSRPVTYATCHPQEDLCLDLCDVVSVNLYPGWYYSSVEGMADDIGYVVKLLEARGAAGKPLILSEIGAAALYGWRDAHEKHYSEQYQAKVLAEAIRIVRSRPRWSGIAIWQFCDVRTEEIPRRIVGRPRGFNNKGVVDEYRRPKMAYEAVKEEFRKGLKDKGLRD